MEDPSYLLKLNRAREHLQSFEEESRAWVETKPYSVVDEPDPEPPPQPLHFGCQARRFRVDRASPIPGRLAVLIGDCVFALRSSLDHLALALAQKHTGPMTEEQARASQFPIFKTAGEYAKNKKRYVGHIAPAAKAAIEALQPYHRGKDYALHVLWQVNEMNNVDKHRTLTACAPVSMSEGRRVVCVLEDGKRNFDYFPYALVTGSEFIQDAVLFRWAGLPIDPNLEMRMQPHVTVEVVLGEGSLLPGCPVGPLLKFLCDGVGNLVIAKLTKFL